MPDDRSQGLGLARGEVQLVEFDTCWSSEFNREASLLRERLGKTVIGIHHVGSEAIAGMMAKPIIDMLLTVKSLPSWEWMGKQLKGLNYEYRANGSQPGKLFFAKGDPNCRTHYLHIAGVDTPQSRELLLFRDYLNSHEDTSKAYIELKQHLQARHGDDRAEYTKRKAEIIQAVLKMAKSGLSEFSTKMD